MPQGAERCAVFCLHRSVEQGAVVQASWFPSRFGLLSWPGRGEFRIDCLQLGACLQRGRCTRKMVAGHGEVTPLTVQLNAAILVDTVIQVNAGVVVVKHKPEAMIGPFGL